MPRPCRLLAGAVLVLASISTTGASQALRPLATGLADFDGDGSDDLAVLYEGGKLETAAFPPDRTPEDVGFSADIMAAGDFDGDGAADVVLGKRGTASLTTLLGDGRGSFSGSVVTPLPGGLTALMAADVNRRDGLLDWVVGIVDGQGPALVVLEGLAGALTAVPERIALSAPPTALAVGRFQGSHLADVAAACGKELVVLAGRDRRLHTPDAPATELVLTAWTLPERVTSLTSLNGERDLALLDAAGAVRVLRDRAIVELASDEAARLRLSASGDGSLTVVPAAVAATYVVNSTADTPDASPGNGVCDDGTGVCTLRAALQEANATGGADEITFSLGSGTPTIAPASALPLVTDTVSIRGNTGGATRIQLDGTAAGFATAALHFSAGSSGSRVRSLVINRFLAWAIRLETADNVVEDCWIGLDAAGGSTVSGNAVGGIWVAGPPATGNLIGGSALGTRNVIARSGGPGVRIESTAEGNRVRGNYIGTNPGANVAMPNADGIQLLGSGAGNRIDGNVISGNTGNGILLEGATTTGTLIEGNLIGTHGSGLVGIGNGQNGILIRSGAMSNTIGGTTMPQRNVISGNSFAGGDGIELNGSGVTSTNVLGNYLGLDAAGAGAIANGQDGILITAGASDTTVGAATATPGTVGGNLISGNNRHGLRIESGSPGTIVQGNVLGLRADGTTAQRNVGSGISVAASTATTVGGSNVNQRNVVSGGNLIALAAGANSTTVQGNFLGTDVSGSVRVVDGGLSATDTTTTGITGLTVGGLAVSPGAPPGNVIAGGVTLSGQGVHDAVVQGNIVGLDVTGSVVLGGSGIKVAQASKNNLIGGTTASARNVLSGNTGGTNPGGVTLQDSGTSGNLVQGNYIGTDITGTIALGNAHGVSVIDGSGNIVGGSTGTAGAPPGNLISGNTGYGISFLGSPQNSHVRGNLVGTRAGGLTALGNGLGGIQLGSGASGCVVGGSAATDRNVISGNAINASTAGVICSSCPSTSALRGNWIGTDINGTAALANSIGVRLDGNMAVGGPNPGEGNVISGNLGVGVSSVVTSNATIAGNLIGVAPDGVSPLGNGSHGISSSSIVAPLVGGTLGGTPGACAGPCNVIRFNGGSGIHLPAVGARQVILGNRISDNAGLGIDLAESGPTPNDPGDASLPQNTPVITLVVRTGATSIQGTVVGAPSTAISIDIYGSPTADASGYGEADVWLGTTTANTDTSGSGNWSISVPSPAPAVLTALATTTARGSSEFALNFLDGDSDGYADGIDVCPEVSNPDQIDDDFDGHGNVCDCAPFDNGAFAPVTEVATLTMEPDRQTVSWASQVPQSGPGTLHQLLRGALGELPVGNGPSELCAASTTAGSFADTSVPAAGSGYWYVVRAKNGCNTSSYGTGSGGSPRNSSTCP